MQTIPLTARSPRAFSPPSLLPAYEEAYTAWDRSGSKKRALRPVKPVFHVAVPTLIERETIGTLMYELGVVEISRETIRNITLEELIDLKGDKGEEEAAWLESFWQQTEIHEEHMELWAEQERQRMLDEWQDPKSKREPFPMPEPLTSVRDRIRARNIVDEVVQMSARIRRQIGAQTRHAKEYEIMSMRLHLRGWEGVKTQREATAGDMAPELVTQDCLYELKEEIGPDAWREIYLFINRQYRLTKEEVGNSGSPGESGSTSDGSIQDEARERDIGRSSGTSSETKSGSTPTPDHASDQTTEASSLSGSEEEE